MRAWKNIPRCGNGTNKQAARQGAKKVFTVPPPSTEVSRSANGQMAARAPVHGVSELRYEERDEAAGPEPDQAAARRRENRHVGARVLATATNET